MFKRLKRHLVFFNIIVTTLILVAAFSTIYMVVKGNIEARVPDNTYNINADSHTTELINARIRDERKVALQSLLITLIVTGMIVEVCVAIFANIWASDAIRPVKKAYETQKIFIANASHEIKTPLAAIQANLEAADVTDNKFIANVEQEVKSLASLNQELLNLAQTDTITTVEKRETDIQPILEGILQDFLPRTSKIRLTVDITDEQVEIAEADFARLATILIDNALKYCDKTVKILYKNRTLIVENDGAIIPEDKMPHIFDRFYQADKSSEGVGLGLSIAMLLVERNNWKINVTSEKVTVFSVKI